MLLGNVYLFNKLPLTQTGGIISNNPMIFRVGDGSFSNKASIPEGYGGKAYILPTKAGGISTDERISIITTGSGAMGINIEGTSSFLIDTNTPDGSLIVSGLGATTFAFTTVGNTTASLNGVASTTFSFSLNHLAMYLDAYGFATASLDLLTSGNGTLRAIAICGGSTVDTSGLSPASIWSYSDRTLTGAGGLSTEQQNQLNSIEAMTGIIPALL